MTIERKEKCPWCGSEVSRARFLEIEAKIRSEEARKFTAAETQLKLSLQQRFNRALESVKKLALKESQERSSKQIEEANTKRLAAEAKVKEMALREAAVKKQIEATAHAQLQREITQVRGSLQKDRDLALLKANSEFNREREALQKKVKVMEHQLLKKTSNELGDGAEIDLYEALRDSFPEDRIKRVPKGANGADVIHEVIYKGNPCGSIAIDSKHRQGWQYTYVTKLRQDQLEAGSEHAILSSATFPTGQREMCICSGVIVVSPARVVYVVEILRKAMIAMHIRGLGMAQRSSKIDALYEFITSESYSQRFVESQDLTEQILAVDVDEKKAHDAIWKKRGAFARRLSGVLRELDTEISAIIEGSDHQATPLRKSPASEMVHKTITEQPYGISK